MRTTLDIDDDVLRLVRELAQRECCSSGEVISRLARAGLRAPSSLSAGARSFFGLRASAPRSAAVNDETIDRLRDEAGI